MSFTQSIPFTVSSNYIYDTDLIEVTGGVAKLKDQLPANATFYANYDSVIDGTWGDGVLTGTAVGGAAISGGKLDLAHTDSRYVSYDANLNADSQQTGCIRMKYTPNYTGSPSADRTFFAIGKALGDIINLIQLKHQSGGTLQVYMVDSTGATIINYITPGWSVVSGQQYELELNFDITTGEIRLFIDGVQFGVTQTNTFIRSADIGIIIIGTNISAAYLSNFYIDDFIYFSTVQHTADYTPGAAISSTNYVTNNPTIEGNISWRNTELEGFTETSTKPGNDEIKYILKKDTKWYYYNGASWVESNETYSQANTAAEIETNKAIFTTACVTSRFKAFLHSDDGSTTPEIDLIEIAYNFCGDAIDSINTCIVWGYTKDPDNTNNNTSISAKLNKKIVQYKTNTSIINKEITDTPDLLNGYWELELIETANMTTSGVKYIFNIGGTEYVRDVPNETNKNFWDLT